jgi:tripartite-type tricarboxylate transporter receptor subunit TctC
MLRRNLLTMAAGLATLPLPALGQTWPSRPVRLIIPYPPGGGTDISGRILAQKLSDFWGQPVVVDNRGGAGGMIGTRAAGQATPDGYTLLYNGTASVVRDNFDPRSVVDHVARATITHNVLVVNQTVPVSTVPEFIAYAKANPGKLNHGTSGPFASQHLAAVMFDLMAGTRLENVHYRGTGPSVAGILANEVQVMFGSMSAVLPLIRDRRVKALATASGRKSLQMPELPTVGEFVPGYAAELTYSFCTPLNTPDAVKRRIEESVRAVVENPAIAQELIARGFEPNFEIGDSLTRAIAEDMDRWADVLKRAGVNLNQQ